MATRSLDGFSIFGLVVVILAMVPVLFPLRIKLGVRVTRQLTKWGQWTRLIGGSSPPGGDSQSSTTAVIASEDDPHEHPPSSTAKQSSNWTVTLNLTTSPPLAVLVLLATTTINGSVIRSGIVGDGDSKPYDVLVLFISLAYIATALDSTGALRSLAFFVANHTSGSGPRLYFVLYCFFFVFGAIFGNDPIILSGTAFLTYFLKHCGITDPTAWIFMEFVASNIASAVLVSSNPTNVLLAQAFDLNFITGFTKFTIIPSVVSAIVGYVVLYTMFKCLTVSNTHGTSSPSVKEDPHQEPRQSSTRIPKSDPTSFGARRSLLELAKSLFRWIPRANYIPDKLHQPIVNPRSVLVDPQGAFFHGTLMITTLLLLVGITFVKNASVWQVTMPAGILALVRDIICDMRSQYRKSSRSIDEALELERNPIRLDSSKIAGPILADALHGKRDEDPAVSFPPPVVPAPLRLVESATPTIAQPPIQANLTRSASSASGASKGTTRRSPGWNVAGCIERLARRFPCTSQTIQHLPLPLVPFAMAMFILISALSHLGWVAVFARWLASVCTSPAVTVYTVGFIGSLVLCPFMGTNIGATILMVRVISDEGFVGAEGVGSDGRILRAAIFGTAMASNIGAFSLTIPSSLAGLLWHQILSQKGIHIRNRHFIAWNFLPLILLSLVAFSIVLVEVLFVF